ncbi:hypothetical protein GLAREA_07595 [Glarea lozoyensis ATCC 20868]|uniref:Cytochrome b561 domain-containing protein n=1 Tax=Glarea lozoyensis (strain ATCC 20868 / MF5171) TaxID=1116229 RepID=S3D1N7_GLAL2|nr:uncharacterized protein GLAREA_07595 [Glarea lozoyensis ATCC 20868]EPE32462.1 hypothetical protein GLAREA_07595 [Glarea lozoyensis ATCC 20868]
MASTEGLAPAGSRMGNRFKNMSGYYNLILGHAILAVITFLVIVPSAIFIARFHRGTNALRWHIYLQIMTVALSTVVLVLGWFAVGPNRSLTNPHHGIGLAIYVLIMLQWLGGSWIYTRKPRTRKRQSLKRYLHQWIGRATALLAIAQVPLGLTLYGSPRWTFILYALWMAFLVLLYFILSYRRLDSHTDLRRQSSHGGTVISDKKSSRFKFLGPLAAGAGAAALLGRRRRSRSRSRSNSRTRRHEVIPSRRGSDSYVDEKFETRKRKESGGFTDKLLKGAALVGAAGLAKSFFDSRKRKSADDASDYTSVAPDTPSRRPSRRHHQESVISDESMMEQGRRPRTPLLPGPGDPVLAAAAISAAQAPTTPRPVRPHSARRSSYDSYSTAIYTISDSPSRIPQKSSGAGKGLLAGLGLGWFGKKMADRRANKEQARLDKEEDARLEEERRRRQSSSRFTGDGFTTPVRKQYRQGAHTDMSSDLSSIIPPDPHQVRPGVSNIPPVPVAVSQFRSRHDITETVAMPPAPPDPQGILHQESGSETYMSPGGHPHRRPSERRRRAGDRAAAEAVAAAAGLAAEEERRRRRSQSRGGAGAVDSPPISVKVKVHGDKDRNVTLRRLTEVEAAAEKEAQNAKARRTRADSMSSLSGSDVRSSRQQRYRRSERAAERRAESIAPPPPLEPPNPSFAAGKRPKDSAYYSGRPAESLGTSVVSPDSHGTWSEMSPSGVGKQGSESHEDKRRRRRLERNRQGAGTGNTVDFT